MFLPLIFTIIFISGLTIGSFLNCVIFRLEKNESFLRGRSYCPHCNHPLAWYDLIPVLSFITLRGRCRYCQKPISYQYPLVELLTGVLFVLILNHELGIGNYEELFNLWTIFNSLFLILISCFLIIIFIYDLRYFIIPDKVLYPAIGISLLYRLVGGLFQFHDSGFRTSGLGVYGNNNFFSFFFAAIIILGFFLFIHLVSRGRWLGFGDVKLGILLGLLLGWPKVLLALFLSFVIGAIIGTGLVVFAQKKLKSEVPFAPFLIIGTFVALFWGKFIIGWYLSLIF